VLRVVLKGWPAEGDAKEFGRVVRAYTGHGKKVAASYLFRLRDGDVVILSVDAESLLPALRQFRGMGLGMVDMYVGSPREE
jgi:hypothetical protein